MADASVRVAHPADAEDIARIQIDTWRIGYAAVLPLAVLESLRTREVARSWEAAIGEPPSPHHRVLVAMEGRWRVGFTAFGPDADAQSEDPNQGETAAISVLLVEPRWGRRGHGSRLLAAVADLAGSGGARRLVAWVPAADTASLQFYRSAGWEADGLQRVLDTGAGTVSELRLHTTLSD